MNSEVIVKSNFLYVTAPGNLVIVVFAIFSEND